jgi:hypothetical protein
MQVSSFVAAYGGVVAGGHITNRTALAARLLPSVQTFAGLFALQELARRGYLRAAHPRLRRRAGRPAPLCC